MKKILIILIISIFITGCYSTQIPTSPTKIGYENYIISIKDIKNKNKKYDKYHKKQKERIGKLQNSKVIPYKYKKSE